MGQGSDVTSCESRFSARTAAQARFRLSTLRHRTNFRVIHERFPCAPPPEWIQLFVWLNLQQGQWHEVCFHHWAGSLMRFTLNINSWQLQVDIQIRTHRYTYCSYQRTSTILKNWKDSNTTVSAFGMLSIYLITQSPATLDTPVQLMINTSTSNNQSRGRSSV